MSDADIMAEWAERQIADYDARRPGTLFADHITMDLAEAYTLQSRVAAIRCQRGERVVGYKVGCTSPTIRQQLGIDHSIAGRLYDTEQHPSCAELNISHFANLAVEGELAVRLGSRPEPRDFGDPKSPARLPACVATIFPVIELHHHVTRGDRPSASELVANNAIHAGVVAGTETNINSANRELLSANPSLKIYSDGQLLDECAGDALISTVDDSLRWLVTLLHEQGEELCEGQIVLTGSITGLIPVTQPTTIQVQTQPLGNVEAKFSIR